MRLHFSLKEKIILGVIVLLIVLIPSTSFYIAHNRTQTQANANNKKLPNVPVTSPKEVPKTNGLSQQGKGSSKAEASPDSSESGLSDDNFPTENTVPPILNPTLNFRLFLEGRPSGKQASKVFVGLSLGQLAVNPKYLLSFIVNLPNSGIYKGLSLAGLDQGKTYTAYLKGPAQIATASAFTITPAPADLGTLQTNTGDVNEDNVIDMSDYNIVKGLLGQTPATGAWNANIDFNLDGIINSLDLAFVSRNINKTGASGPWYSSLNPLKSATSSATVSGSLNSAPSDIGGPQDGFWMWFPAVN